MQPRAWTAAVHRRFSHKLQKSSSTLTRSIQYSAGSNFKLLISIFAPFPYQGASRCARFQAWITNDLHLARCLIKCKRLASSKNHKPPRAWMDVHGGHSPDACHVAFHDGGGNLHTTPRVAAWRSYSRQRQLRGGGHCSWKSRNGRLRRSSGRPGGLD
jgi:hypothetical protein